MQADEQVAVGKRGRIAEHFFGETPVTLDGTDLSNKSISDCGDLVHAIRFSGYFAAVVPRRRSARSNSCGSLRISATEPLTFARFAANRVFERYAHTYDLEHGVERRFQSRLAIGSALLDGCTFSPPATVKAADFFPCVTTRPTLTLGTGARFAMASRPSSTQSGSKVSPGTGGKQEAPAPAYQFPDCRLNFPAISVRFVELGIDRSRQRNPANHVTFD